MSRITSNDALGLMEAYNSIYIQEQKQEPTLEEEIFETIAYAFLSQGHTADDVVEYFESVDEETLAEDFLSLIEEEFIIESVVSEEYIQEQYEILVEGASRRAGTISRLLQGAGNLLKGSGGAIIQGAKNLGTGALNLAQRGVTSLKNRLFPTVRQARAAAAAKPPKAQAASATRPAAGTPTGGGSWNKPTSGSNKPTMRKPSPAGGAEARRERIAARRGELGPAAQAKQRLLDQGVGRTRRQSQGLPEPRPVSTPVKIPATPKSNAARNVVLGGSALGAAGGLGYLAGRQGTQGATSSAPAPSAPAPDLPKTSAAPAPSAPAPAPSAPAPAPSAPAPAPSAPATPRAQYGTGDFSSIKGRETSGTPLWGSGTSAPSTSTSGSEGPLWGAGTTAKFDTPSPAKKPIISSIFDKEGGKEEWLKKMRSGLSAYSDTTKQGDEVKRGQKIASSYEYTDAYDVVMEYLFSTGQVDTLEEANYVMLEMNEEAIGNILEYCGFSYGEVEEYVLSEEYEEYEDFLDEAICYLLDEGLSYEDIENLTDEDFINIYNLDEGKGRLLFNLAKSAFNTFRQGRLFKRSGQPYNFATRQGRSTFKATDPIPARRPEFRASTNRAGVIPGGGAKKQPKAPAGQMSIDFSAKPKPQAPAAPTSGTKPKPTRNTIPDFINSINAKPTVNAPVKAVAPAKPAATPKNTIPDFIDMVNNAKPSRSLPSVRTPSAAERRVTIGGGRKRGTVDPNRFQQPDSTDFQKKVSQSKTLGDLARSYGADIDWKNAANYGKTPKPTGKLTPFDLSKANAQGNELISRSRNLRQRIADFGKTSTPSAKPTAKPSLANAPKFNAPNIPAPARGKSTPATTPEKPIQVSVQDITKPKSTAKPAAIPSTSSASAGKTTMVSPSSSSSGRTAARTPSSAMTGSTTSQRRGFGPPGKLGKIATAAVAGSGLAFGLSKGLSDGGTQAEPQKPSAGLPPTKPTPQTGGGTPKKPNIMPPSEERKQPPTGGTTGQGRVTPPTSGRTPTPSGGGTTRRPSIVPPVVAKTSTPATPKTQVEPTAPPVPTPSAPRKPVIGSIFDKEGGKEAWLNKMRGGKVPQGNDFPSRKDIESSSTNSLNNGRYKSNV